MIYKHHLSTGNHILHKLHTRFHYIHLHYTHIRSHYSLIDVIPPLHLTLSFAYPLYLPTFPQFHKLITCPITCPIPSTYPSLALYDSDLSLPTLYYRILYLCYRHYTEVSHRLHNYTHFK